MSKSDDIVAKSTDTFGTLSLISDTSGASNASSHNSGEVQERDEDFTKDNVASPIDLECHIQAERITKILDEAIYKTKLAVCLPDLVQEYRTLASILSPQNMDDLIFIFDQYDNPLFSTSLLNMAAMEDLRAGDLTMKNRLNPELGHIIYVLNSYPSLRPIVEDMIVQMKEEYKTAPSTNYQASLEYLLTLEQFRNQMVVQMATTAAEELGTKLQTKKLETSNKHYLDCIKDYTKALKDENEHFENVMKKKANTISKLEQELALLHQDASIKLKKKILDSERQMVLASRAHEIKQELLKEEEVEVKDTYNSMLHQHLIDEKTLRARRFKVETQLLSWLQKYDTEMGDKQAELDELTQMYDDEVQKCEELEEKLVEQDKEYLPLMEEREKEYHQEMTEKMNRFLLEHAARVIQVAWRNVVANRNEKKKLRKLLKLKQAAEEREAARAAAAAAAAAKAAKKAKKEAKALAKAQAKAARKAEKDKGEKQAVEEEETKSA